jgi:hypothetical protein
MALLNIELKLKLTPDHVYFLNLNVVFTMNFLNMVLICSLGAL